MRFCWCSPVWPYLGLLACALGLLLTAPASWQHAFHPAHSAPSPEDVARLEQVSAPSAELAILPETVVVSPSESTNLLPSPTTGNDPQATALDYPSNLPPVRLGDSSDRLAMLPTHGAKRPSMVAPKSSDEVSSNHLVTPTRWSVPPSLLEGLKTLSQHAALADWTDKTEGLVRKLIDETTIDSTAAATVIEQLEQQRKQLDELLTSCKDPNLETEILRIKYALSRRLEVWQAAVQTIESPADAKPDYAGHEQLSQQLAAVAALTDAAEAGKAWSQYLMLDALRSAVEQGDAAEQEQRRLARRVLGRLSSGQLSPAQREFLSAGPLAELDSALRHWSSEPVEMAQLLADLEEYEGEGQNSAARLIADSYQRLAWSPSEEHQQLARNLERHYRNANVRIALSGDLVNRMLPEQEPLEMPIHDRILGADVEGYSWTTTKLHVRLLPHDRQLRFGLEARGEVSTSTQASSGPAVFSSVGQTHYLARKLVAVQPHGLNVWPAVADASGSSDLLAVNTQFDDLPFVRSIVRNIAKSQHMQAQDQALWVTEQKVSTAARERLDEAANERLEQATERYKKQVLGRLAKLSLEPTPLDLMTTEERLIMRLRLASDQQLGAHTPRPRAPSDSALSVQVHESAFNNALAQLELDGRTFTLVELHDLVSEKFSLNTTAPEDLSRRATVKFASQNAVHVRCHQGRIELTLSISQIAESRHRFRDFQVRAFYRPETNGLHTQLVRDGSIQLIGDRLNLGSQIALRGIFSKLLSQNRHPQLVPKSLGADPRFKGLEVTQLSIDDGWLGVAIGPVMQQAQRNVPPRHQ